MLDQSEKGSESEDMNSQNQSGLSSDESHKKICADCGTSKTPLWRGGPAGPKSLCNACGIRNRKKRRAVLGLNKGSSEDKKAKRSNSSSISSSSSSSNNNNNSSNGKNRNKIGDNLNQRLMALGREVLMQRSTVEKQRRKLGEEEQAAVLLMALSYGSVYA